MGYIRDTCKNRSDWIQPIEENGQKSRLVFTLSAKSIPRAQQKEMREVWVPPGSARTSEIEKADQGSRLLLDLCLAGEGGAPLEQIQLSLGHASLLSTECYLGMAQDLISAPLRHAQAVASALGLAMDTRKRQASAASALKNSGPV